MRFTCPKCRKAYKSGFNWADYDHNMYLLCVRCFHNLSKLSHDRHDVMESMYPNFVGFAAWVKEERDKHAKCKA